MSPSRNKAQLGVRVSPEAKEMAVARAKSVGKTLNQYIEWLIRSDCHENGVAPHARPVVPGQLDLTEALTEMEAEVAGVVAAPTPAEVIIPQDSVDNLTRFQADCSMVAYHWKSGPGNPCRRCGGEI